MTEIRFGCGEFVPGSRRIPDRKIDNTDPPIYIPTDPFPFPGPPRVPRVPVEEWVCVCTRTTALGGIDTCIPATRRCEIKSSIAPGTPTTRSFLTKAACENVGYGEQPCSIAAFECFEQELPCPQSYGYSYIARRCIYCGQQKNVPQPGDRCPHIYGCPPTCISDKCPDPPPGPVTPAPTTGGGGRPGYETTGTSTPGPTTPTVYWGCFDVSTPCPEPNQDKTYSVTTACRSTAPITTMPPPGYIYRSELECRRRCASSPIFYPCPADGPYTQEPPRPGGTAFDPTAISGPNLEDLTYTIINRTGLEDSTTRIGTGNRPLLDTFIDVFDVDNFFNSNFVDNQTSSGGGVYHTVYNMFSHEDQLSQEFVGNALYLNIFADYIPKAVSYLLKYSNTNIEWNEKYITGVSKANLIKSLNGTLYQAFKSLVDIDGQAISVDYFLGVIKKHLLKGTIDKFDAGYYINLAKKQTNYPRVALRTSTNAELNRRAALGVLSKYSKPLAIDKYTGLQNKIDINRSKFLLTDIEAAITVETVAEETYTVPLEEPGMSVSSVSALEEFVPVGDGGGYYLVIETIDGEVIPVDLDTAVSAAYYVPPSERKLALSLMGEDSRITLSVSSSFDDSEFGDNYYTSYAASADYYKLDLQSITQAETTDSLVEVSIASYVKLTDIEEIQQHAKTYGSRSSQINVQYDDPFIQYADRAGRFTLQQRDITFRQFNPTRSSGDYSIITRSLPYVLILNPVSAVQDNPFYSYSNLDTISNTNITRSLRITPHFGLSEDNINKLPLQQALIYNEERKYKLGLVEQADTQNIYYLFNRDAYDTYQVDGRSEVGSMFYDLLKERLQTKYEFDYLTWWDIYRRMKLTEFAKFIYFAPQKLIKELEIGFKGFKVKSVLDRENVIPSVLILKEGQTEDSVVLSDRVRNAKSS